MLLSNLIDKTLLLDKSPKGICIAVGISLKNKQLKYLFCSNQTYAQSKETDFVLPISALASFGENALSLSRIRPVLPNNYHKLNLTLPIYSENGTFLGNILDIKFQSYIATAIQTDNKEWIPFPRVIAIHDAIIVRKTQRYPLGQPIPQQDAFVTKHLLKTASKEKRLIRLTLSLPPFSLY